MQNSAEADGKVISFVDKVDKLQRKSRGITKLITIHHEWNI